LNWTRGYFEGAGIIQPRLEAEILLAHALEVDRLQLYLSPDKPLTEDERSRFRGFVVRRKAGTPLQHLIGEVTFFGLRFKVRRDALIPRPETEQLLDRTLKLVPRDRPSRCLDLGTGSGVDVSSDALALAAENAESNGVADRIDFLASDWFAAVDGEFDLIVSNPPYVATDEIPSLPTEVRQHEPRVALDGGDEGLECIGRLLGEIGKHLASEGRVLLEIGHGQGERVKGMMDEVGLVDVSIDCDLSGRERFAFGRGTK
jgi:release factor glutamine methyltransferase